MAVGDAKIFNEFVLKERNQTYGVSDVKTLAFVSNTFASVSDDLAKDASNPATVRCAVIYNNTSAADDLIQIYDLTADGSTALDLVNNDFVFNFGAAGINTATV